MTKKFPNEFSGKRDKKLYAQLLDDEIEVDLSSGYHIHIAGLTVNVKEHTLDIDYYYSSPDTDGDKQILVDGIVVIDLIKQKSIKL